MKGRDVIIGVAIGVGGVLLLKKLGSPFTVDDFVSALIPGDSGEMTTMGNSEVRLGSRLPSTVRIKLRDLIGKGFKVGVERVADNLFAYNVEDPKTRREVRVVEIGQNGARVDYDRLNEVEKR